MFGVGLVLAASLAEMLVRRPAERNMALWAANIAQKISHGSWKLEERLAKSEPLFSGSKACYLHNCHFSENSYVGDLCTYRKWVISLMWCFSNALTLCSLLGMRDQVSYLYGVVIIIIHLWILTVRLLGGWKKVHYDEINNFYSSPDFVRMSQGGWDGQDL